MLWDFVGGACSYDALYRLFYFHYVDYLKDDSLSDSDWETFGLIHGKMDFVGENPNKASRRDGWISSEEYREWLRAFLTSHFAQKA